MILLVNQGIFIIKIPEGIRSIAERADADDGSEHPPKHADEAAVIDRMSRHRRDQRVAPLAQQGKPHPNTSQSRNCKNPLWMQGGKNETSQER